MDFSKLSDDQLLQLLQAAMAEAIARGGAVRAAAHAEVLTAQERAEIQNRVAEAYRLQQIERERQRVEREAQEKLKAEELKKQAQATESTWAAKSAIVAAVRAWGYDGDFQLNIWSSGADRRVYFEKPSGNRRRGSDWKWCLYLTGNRYHPPGELEGEGEKCFFDDKQDQLKAFLAAVAKNWTGDLRIDQSAESVAPSDKRLKEYLQVLGLETKEASNV